MSTIIQPLERFSDEGPPAWAIAQLFPEQGTWTEDEYLEFTRNTRRLVELTDGVIEVLPMPTTSHQLILQFLYGLVSRFVTERKLGIVCFAGIRVRVKADMFRQPDLLYMAREHFDRVSEEFWQGVDVAFEVVSKDAGSRERDYQKKRKDYSTGRIPEYWIVDPDLKLITVLVLKNKSYVEHGVFGIGDQATSVQLADMKVDVREVFDAGKLP